jgi:outer membrane lipoprotein SlyB
MKSKLLLALPVVAVLLSSCAQDTMTGDTYSRAEAGRAHYVQTGRVTSVRFVKIEGGSQAGTVLGAVAGGLLGSNIGGGRASNTAGAIGGAVVGGALGSHAQQSMSSRRGIEFNVRLDQGGTLSVVQEDTPREPFYVGDRVRVIDSGGRSRVSH